jgi:hypothetical protein
VAGLNGTGRLADDFYLLAHHEATGRPFLHPLVTGLGLAAAPLADLILTGHLSIKDGEPVLLECPPPSDELSRRVLGVVRGEPGHLARVWLCYLGRSAAPEVALRLAEDGYLAAISSRRPRRSPRWVPADRDCGFAPVVRVRPALDPAGPAPIPQVVLAGLALACGLGPRLLPYGPPGARRSVDDRVSQLPANLRELTAQTQTASTRCFCPTASRDLPGARLDRCGLTNGCCFSWMEWQCRPSMQLNEQSNSRIYAKDTVRRCTVLRHVQLRPLTCCSRRQSLRFAMCKSVSA